MFQVRKFLIIPFLLITLSQIRAEESPIPEINEDMLKQARQIVGSIKKVQASKEYQDHKNWISKNRQKLLARQEEQLPTIDYGISQEQLQKDAIATLLNKYRLKNNDVQKAQITNFPLMIFVSKSIPESSLKDLMIQAKKAGGVLVFRGMMGSLKNTVNFLGKISKDDVQAIIDPRLFDIFNIQTVPTIVVLKDIAQDCGSEDCQITPIHDKISGNITLDYALEIIVNVDGDASKFAKKFLAKIRAGGLDEKI